MDSHNPSPRVSLASAFEADHPGPRWRLLSWSVGVGTLLLGLSVITSVLAMYSPSWAGDSSSGSSGNSSYTIGLLRPVAIAFVDIESGVRNLYPVQQGRVAELPVAEGTEVPEGTVLLRLDDSQAKIKVAQARVAVECSRKRLEQAKQLRGQHHAQIKAQEAAIAAARSKKAAAEAILDKTRRLRRDKAGASDEDVRVAETAVAEARDGILAAQAKLEAIKAMEPETTVAMAELDVKAKEQQLEEAKLALKEHTVVAPCKGTILRSLTRVGEVLGANPKQPAIEFCPVGERIVRAEVEQEFAYQVAIGQKARITDDAKTSTSEWTGTVKHISDWFTQRRAMLFEPMQFNDVRTLEVILRLDDPKHQLRIGQRVRVELEGKK